MFGEQEVKHNQLNQIKNEDLESPIKRHAPSFKAQDPLIEANLGTKVEPRMMKVSGLLAKEDRNRLVKMVK